uniref:OTU domain-containing protein n=1 Tax=Amphimedon queenslandica TaxID=400682 RepID=A0A1X7UZM6_AMPQE
DWVQKAVAIISKLSGITVVQRVDAVKKVPYREIAPLIQDEIVRDGACFYRTIAKAITGIDDNHFAVRMSLRISCLTLQLFLPLEDSFVLEFIKILLH